MYEDPAEEEGRQEADVISVVVLIVAIFAIIPFTPLSPFWSSERWETSGILLPHPSHRPPTSRLAPTPFSNAAIDSCAPGRVPTGPGGACVALR